MSSDSEIINPIQNMSASQAAQQVVIELIRAGSLKYPKDIIECFTLLSDHYRSERNRILSGNKAQ